MQTQMDFHIISSNKQIVKEEIAAKIEIEPQYIKIVKKYVALEDIVDEDGLTVENESYLDTEWLIFKENITELDFKTSYPFAGSEFMYQLSIFVGEMIAATMDFKRKKDCVAMRDKILEWKLSK